MPMPIRVVWLDKNKDSTVPKRLRKIVPDLSTYSSIVDCVDSICSISSAHNNVVLIISGSFDSQTAELIDILPQLRVIYIYCCDASEHITWTTQRGKIGVDEIFDQENDLIVRLTTELNETTTETSPFNTMENETDIIKRDKMLMFSIFTKNIENNSARDLIEEKTTFIWLQILTNVLINMPKLEKEAQNELISLCRREYKKDKQQIKLIEEFSNKYTASEAIRWFTRNVCFYKLLNQALRTQDFYIIFKFRSFITDVHQQLNDLFTPIADSSLSFRVYRGQLVAISEMEKLRVNMGGIISMNSFVSTSRDEFCFMRDVVSEPGFAIVLFDMVIDTRIAQAAGTPFANIQEHSCIPDEEEILLSMGTMFRIDSITEEIFDSSNVWRIKLVMCTIDDDPQIKMLVDYVKDNICSHGTMTFSTYGKLLACMSHFDSSVVYHCQLLNQLPSDHKDLPIIHNDLAYAYRESNRFPIALEHYNIALLLQEKQVPRDDVNIAMTYSDLGWLLMQMKDLEKSLEFHQKALVIREQHLGNNHVDTAISYDYLGLCYLKTNDFNIALFYLQEALAIRKRCLPARHPYIAMSYCSMGSYFSARKDHSEALHMYEQTISIYKSSMPPTHKTLALTHSSLATSYVETGQWEKAIQNLKTALEICPKNDFHNQAISLNTLGFVYYKLRDYKQALAFYDKALQLTRKDKNTSIAASIEKNIKNLHVRELAEFQDCCVM
ncbi:unnamed protein product [Rotaria socialis]|uniref:NAD(P)(+)--arginine ADP-ribosyltransferase n=1 Tax=Rotaria socialis TaxID=392032 RepID=A0A821T8W7_9BILA|nr:unnamed protein product [Rotaria socialis]CAF4870335.1 unnamed protein product [Rotaria socialis]